MNDAPVLSTAAPGERHVLSRIVIPVQAQWQLGLFVVAYCAAYLYGNALPVPAPLWPPDGVLLAALLLTPPRRWWTILLIVGAIRSVPAFAPGAPAWLLLLNFLNDVLKSLLAAVLLRRFAARPLDVADLRTLRIYLACAVLAAPLLSAFAGAAGRAALGSPYWPAWQTWFLGDALANLVLTPAILLWAGAMLPWPRTAERWRIVEALLLCAALVSTSIMAFAGVTPQMHSAPPQLYLIVPPLLWASVRFGPRGIAGALTLVTFFAMTSLTAEPGLFSLQSPAVDVLSLQVFLIVIAVPLLVLAALTHEGEHAAEALRESEERYRAVVSNLPRGFATLFDADLRYLLAEGPGLTTAKERLVGKTIWELFPPERCALLEPPMRAALAGQASAQEISSGGRWYSVQCSPISHGTGIAGLSLTFDITERKQAEAAQRELAVRRQTEEALRESEARLRHANAELERASRLKSEFLATISHEFRTPLTLLLGPLQELLAAQPDRLPPDERESLEIAHRSGMHLLKLVNALLDFSRLEAGRLQPTYRPTDLAAYTAELAGVFRSAAERAGLRLAVDCPPLPEPAYVDREMWEKIVLNLLSNALKFTFAGEIAVTLRAQGGGVVLAVRDTGTGIPPEELPHLFERFHRVQGAKARTHEGAGIGLALVRQLVRLHGGTVEVTSTLGAGSTFTVAIPRGTAHLPADQGETAVAVTGAAGAYVEEAWRWLPEAPRRLTMAGDRGDLPGPAAADGAAPPARLLVVDDNADMRAYLTRLLRGRGIVEAIGDGATALEVARAWVPDLILADVMMPGLDGFALLQAVRADPRLRPASVILLSARSGDEARVEGLRAGADDYLVKPFSAAGLLARVDGQLALVRLRGEARASEERQRLARDLHDSVAQSLYSLTLLAEAGRRALLSGRGTQVDEYLDRLGATAQQTLREMRLLVFQLRPPALAQNGLVQALERRLETVERRAGIAAQLLVEGTPSLPPPVEEALYHIAQEALTNALKHAAASEVTVRLAFIGDAATLSVSDNGRGLDLAAVSGGGGLGLVSMRERAERIGGSFTIEPAGGGGTRVTAALPSRGQLSAGAAQRGTVSPSAGIEDG